jgi:hypothetical protein
MQRGVSLHMQDILTDLCFILYCIHDQFYDVDTDRYCDMISEFGKLADSVGYDANKIAQLIVAS